MSAPDPKAVEAALRDCDAAHRCIGSHTFAPDTMRTLEAAAYAYLDALRAPTAPQGAEPAYRPALAALMDYKQADEDGVMVLVSRQAIHEVFDALTWHDKHAAPQGAEIARDAARYRWLRANCRVTWEAGGGVPEHATLLYRHGLTAAGKKLGRMAWNAVGLDACIDAALTPTDAETK